MIQNTNINEFQRRFQSSRNTLVSLARFGNARRMYVAKYYGSSTKVEGPLDDDARIDGGAIDGAVKSAIEFY